MTAGDKQPDRRRVAFRSVPGSAGAGSAVVFCPHHQALVPVQSCHSCERFVGMDFTAQDDHRVEGVTLRYRIHDEPERIVKAGESGGDAIRVLLPATRTPKRASPATAAP